MDVWYVILGPLVGATAGYGFSELRHHRDRADQAEDATLAQDRDLANRLQDALEDLVLGTGLAHNARFDAPLKAWGGEIVREMWAPSAPMPSEIDQQLARATSRVDRYRHQVADAELTSMADECLRLSMAVLQATDVNVARDELAELGATLQRAHTRGAQLLGTPAST